MVGRYGVLGLLPLLLLAAFPGPGAAASEDMANVLFEAATPAPVVALAAGLDATDLLAVDEEARFTFLGDTGEIERAWTAPPSGHLSSLDPALGEIDPTPAGVAVVPDGTLWAGAVAYDGAFPGRVYGFGHWSDTPIWTYKLPTPPAGEDADQPVAMTGGGPYYAIATAKGSVMLFTAEADSGTTKYPHRTYTRDNQGNAFGTVNDIALSRDGGRVLIGTGATGESALHLFSDTFFLRSFHRIEEPVHQVAMSADGSRGAAITGSGAGTRAHLLDLDNGTTLWETTVGSDVRDLALSPDGLLLVLGTDAGNLQLYRERGDILDREPIAEHYLASPVSAVAVADNGHTVAAATDEGVAWYVEESRPDPLWSHDVETPLVDLALASDEGILALGAAGDGSGRIIVTGAKHVLDHAEPPQPRLLPGVANAIRIEVANNGNRMETVQAVAGGLPKGWTSTPYGLLLAPGEQRTASLEITVAKGQPQGDFQIALSLVTPHQTIPFTVDARVPEVASARVTEAWRFDHAVPGGAPAAFLLSIENLGNVPNEVALGYSGLPAGWKADFQDEVEFRLQPGEDREVTLLVFAPRDALVGREAWFDLVLAGQHGEWKTPVTIVVTDGPSYHYALRLAIDSDPERDPDVAPLQDALRERIETDLEETREEAKSQQSGGKRKTKDSPGVGLVPLLALATLGALVLRRRVVLSSPETRAQRWSFPELLHDPTPASRLHDGRKEHDDARDPPHGRREHR